MNTHASVLGRIRHVGSFSAFSMRWIKTYCHMRRNQALRLATGLLVHIGLYLVGGMKVCICQNTREVLSALALLSLATSIPKALCRAKQYYTDLVFESTSNSYLNDFIRQPLNRLLAKYAWGILRGLLDRSAKYMCAV